MENYPEFDPSIAAEFGDGASVATFLGAPLFQADSLLNLLIRFGFNLLVSWIIVQFFYYKKSRRRDYYVTFMLFSAVMFLLIFLRQNILNNRFSCGHLRGSCLLQKFSDCPSTVVF
jgi:hypothetical protein